jgi:hypothetical protein
MLIINRNKNSIFQNTSKAQHTNNNNVYACNFIIHVITNPLFLGLYIPCRKVDTWWPPKIKDQVEQNRLFIITLQESCTWINFGKKIFVLNHITQKLQKRFK